VSILFSIVIPTFNRKEKLCRSIRSALFFLSSGSCELIVVDDASTDGTIELINELFCKEISLGLIKVLSLTQNIGVTGARNKGIELALGEWIVFLDSDDVFLTNSYTEFVKELERLTEYDLLFFRCADLHSGLLIGPSANPEDFSFRRLFNDGTPGECLPVIKRDVILKFPYYTKLRGCEGLTYFDILNNGGRAYLSDKILRGYDSSGIDRLSTRKATIQRAKQMTYFNVLSLRYIKYANLKKIIGILLRILYYSLRSIRLER
jgi:glycosyltransferase involved in cell wall biosynthesis